jgi:hypothetical protein
LASTVRPTSLAAVSALLTNRYRSRLLFAYVIAGLASVAAFGAVVVGALHGIHLNTGSGRVNGTVDIVAGVVAVLFGCAILGGLFRRPRQDAPEIGGGWRERLYQRVTVPVAAVAGPLTHIPGLFYLVALNVIVAHNLKLSDGLVAVLIYDAVWFALPIAALAMCTVKPDAAQAVVESTQRWTNEHARTLVVVTSFVVGVALVVRGVLAL